jgi:putative FmdB family regulatory protein
VPIYEFSCKRCDRRFSLFFRTVAAASEGACPACGSAEIERAVSRVAVLKGDRGRAESLDTDRILDGLDDSDVGSFARWARKVGSEYDAELGTNYRELAERAEAGDDPIERIDAGYSLNYQVEKRRAEVDTPAQPASGDGTP